MFSSKLLGGNMPKPYSKDLRIRVVNRVKDGKECHQQIADNFGVGIATLRRWIKLHKDTGSVEHTIPTVTRPRKVNYKKAQKFIEKNPDKTLKEIGAVIGTKNVLYVIKKLNITYKKTLPVRGKTGRFERGISKSSKSNSKRKSHLSR
jgi:transposase